jgi:hypothetical protein
VTFQKTLRFIITHVKTSNLTRTIVLKPIIHGLTEVKENLDRRKIVPLSMVEETKGTNKTKRSMKAYIP